MAVFLTLTLGHSSRAAALSMPELGERVYIIADDAISRIVPLDDLPSKQVIMRDPILLDHPGTVFPMHLKAAKPKRTPRKILRAKLNFRQKAILGRYSNPRISFELKPLLLERADVSADIDVIGNIFRSNTIIEGE